MINHVINSNDLWGEINRYLYHKVGENFEIESLFVQDELISYDGGGRNNNLRFGDMVFNNEYSYSEVYEDKRPIETLFRDFLVNLFHALAIDIEEIKIIRMVITKQRRDSGFIVTLYDSANEPIICSSQTFLYKHLN